ncbi:lipid II:glycine glycyltransferase FemX [Trueperella pyogenes]|uniref:lipid II:glycine glycyltransferase FemX n=1 Tax=Trueperella pyogenes TaxID=1661 RepID=UPI0024C09990|nr:peptidoglycan bridge formation glycyltransferase FemA/FemB family protein [Trueperella pyogenes]WHU58489.1 peptidoglycan bridge formation glycyltransferase FemA/FemB family protein [Trueperella pyogenes]
MNFFLEVIDSGTYEDFIASHSPRLFLPQTPEYVRARANRGGNMRLFGLFQKQPDASTALRGVAAVYFQPWRKFFKRALVTYGPLVDDAQDTNLIGEFARQLANCLQKDKKTLTVRINPLVPRAFYDDIEVTGENPQASELMNVLEAAGFTRIRQEFYEKPDVQIRFIYTKDLEGMSFEDALSTLAKGLRRRFRAEGRYGIDVRFVGADRFEDFLHLYELTAERNSMTDLSGSSISLYKDLMEQFGPERSILCIAYYSASRHLEQIHSERKDISARRGIVAARKETKAQIRELAELDKAEEALRTQADIAKEFAAKNGDEVPVNSALGFVTGDELLLLLGAMNKEYHSILRDYPVERALFKWACDHRIKIYNTFGISGIFDESAPDANILRFKQWLNGNVEEFIGSFEKILHPAIAKVVGVEV